MPFEIRHQIVTGSTSAVATGSFGGHYLTSAVAGQLSFRHTGDDLLLNMPPPG